MDLINIDEIIIGDRFRSDPGNVSDLMDSIEKIGLLHPIVINSEYQLIAGHRRLIACKKLGETSIPCTILDIEDIKKAETDENIVRQDFTNSEIRAIHKYFHEAESRQGDNRGDGPGFERVLSDSENTAREHPAREYPIDKTVKATGKSTDTISKINQVMEAESDSPIVQKKIDEIKAKIDDQPVDRSYREVKKLLTPEPERPDPEFLVRLIIDLIKKQEEGDRIFKDLYEILQYPDGAKILKNKISRYKTNG